MNITRFTVNENSSVTLLDAIVDANYDYATINDIEAISCAVYDVDDRSIIKESTELEVSEVMRDTPATGNGWTRNKTGWNSKIVVSGDEYGEPFPEGGKTVRVEVKYVFTSGYVHISIFEGDVIEVFTQ